MPDYIQDLIRDKNKQRKKWQQTHDPQDALILRQKQLALKKDKHKNDAWGETIRALSTQDSSLWRLTRRLKNKHTKIPSLQTGTIQTDKQKADTLAESFAAASQQRVNNLTSQTYPIPPPLLKKLLIKPKDVTNITKTLPANKSPGPDEISNLLIKNFTLKAVVQFTHIMNAIMQLQYFPQQWKKSIVVPILKPGKNPEDPTSYRPISLLCSLSKLAERVLLTRLKMLGIEQNIPNEQFGF